MSCAILNPIKELRFDRDEMTQQDLADRIGVTRQTVNAIEQGKFRREEGILSRKGA